MANKLPPHDVEAEAAIIGSLLLRGSPDEHALEEIPFLRPEDFFREKNRWLYETILALARRQVAIDQITVAYELARQDKLEALGGPAYILHVLGTVPTSYHLKFYAEIVHDLAERRRAIARAGEMAREAWEGKPDLPIIPL